MEIPKLFPYQLDVTGRARARVKQGARRVLIQAVMGAGKGHLVGYLSRLCADKGGRCLVVNNRRDIVSELSRRLHLFGVPHNVLMSGESWYGKSAVNVASRDTLLSRSCRNDWMALPSAELVIVDEAHRASSPEYRALLERYPDAVVIGMTATPARADGSGLGTSFWQALECAVPPSELIRLGRLVPVHCFAPEGMVKGRKGGGLRGDPVLRWKQHAAGKPTIAFTAKVEQSLALVERFRAAGVSAVHVDAHTPDDERDRAKEDLRSGRVTVLSNCGVFLEGTDIPELGCVVMLRKCGSRVLYLQAAGRCMRAAPGKDHAVLLDHAGAVLRHGLPHADVEWSLDADDTVDRRYEKARDDGREKQPCYCPSCGRLFDPAPLCPHCGHKLAQKAKAAEALAETLLRVPDDLKPRVELEARTRMWKKALAVAAARRGTVGAAAAIYKRESGLMPWQTKGLHPTPPCSGSRDWAAPVVDVYPQYYRAKTGS